MDWNLISKRRNLNLEKMLEGIQTEQEALKMFADNNISNPPMSEVRNILDAKLFVKLPTVVNVSHPDEIVNQTNDATTSSVLVVKTAKTGKKSGN